jgi:hypothetical protein
MSLLTRKRAILSKIETTYGVDPVPTGGADAILMSNFNVSPMEMNEVERQNVKSYIGNNPSVIGAVWSKVSFDVEMAGSGTAGTPPGYDELLRACAFSATTLAAAVSGTATAGSSTTITLAAGASAVDNAYAGMTINITGGTGSGTSAVIASYVGSTKVATLTNALATPLDATSAYTIPIQVVYRRVSSNFESAALYCNVDGVRHILLGARGTVSVKGSAQGIPMWSFTLTGLYGTPTDVAIPAVTLTQYAAPLAINNANTSGININGYTAAVLSDFSIDVANQVVFRSLPGTPEYVTITDAKPTGSLTFEATTVAAKDWWTLMKNATLGPFSMTHGTAAGNKIKIDAPAQQLSAPSYGDKDGITMLTTKTKLVPVNGSDELTICFL